MNKCTYESLERYMFSCMEDSAHDREHVYRVLYNALDIAGAEKDVDYDVLIAACLLHDIGRREQFENPALCHAAVGGEKAYDFLTAHGFDENYARRVRECIVSHRYRKSAPPQSVEARILFDADKLDAAGAMGMARSLIYKGIVGEPLYTVLPDGEISDGSGDAEPSFFQEYRFKLERIYTGFFTARGAQLAGQRKAAAEEFYASLYSEAAAFRSEGKAELESRLVNGTN